MRLENKQGRLERTYHHLDQFPGRRQDEPPQISDSFFCGKTFAASLRGNSSFGATQIASGQWAPSRVLRLCQRVPYELPTSSP